MNIRSTRHDDLAPLQRILDETDLFPSEMLADMLQGFLSGDDSSDIWLTCDHGGQVLGFCYAVPEQLADGVWNMLAIAVLPDQQGRGTGGALTRHLEEMLKRSGERILIAETSGTDAFAQTRAFYRKNGYVEEARIRAFWGPEDDKIIFWKSLD